MSRRREVEEHRRRLNEVRNILNSMKTLAFMETRKLTKRLAPQHEVVEHLQQVAQDFVLSYPDVLPPLASGPEIRLLIGSERGFCGDFNHALIGAMEDQPRDRVRLVAIGAKLATRVAEHPAMAATASGATVAEEVPAVLESIVDHIIELQQDLAGCRLTALHYGDDGQVIRTEILPPFRHWAAAAPPTSHAYPLLLNLPPHEFLRELIDHYVHAVLHELLYASLSTENHRRVQHLGGAIRRLDDKSTELQRRSNTLRQEEITEEIEVILLSVEPPARPSEQ